MPRSITTPAIVLKTYDVGEADRFCVLLTDTLGKLAARATAVRKLKSKMGGTLLSPNSVELQLTEGRTGWIVTGAKLMMQRSQPRADQFAHRQHGLEILLSLIHDEEPLPEIFERTEIFLNTCRGSSDVLGYTISLLHHLGMLPSHSSLPMLTESQKKFIDAVLSQESPNTLTPHEAQSLDTVCMELIADHSSRTLRTPGIIKELV